MIELALWALGLLLLGGLVLVGLSLLDSIEAYRRRGREIEAEERHREEARRAGTREPYS